MNLKVTLNWAYIKNEIDYETYKAAEITITNDPVVKGEAQSDNTNADADFCRAKIDTAVATLEEIMHRHYLTTSLEEATNELDRTRQSWVMNLYYADSDRRIINLDSLTAKCHRFVVDYVLQEWCKLALPSLVEGYKLRMSEEEEAIGQLINRKQAPTLFDDEEEETIDTTIEGLSATATAVKAAAGTAPGAEVTITKTTREGGITVPCFNFTFNIPEGMQGEQGVQGEKGEQGIQGLKGDDGIVDYDAVYARLATDVDTRVTGLNATTKAALEAEIADIQGKQADFIQNINSKIAAQNVNVAEAISEVADVKNFIDYDTNQPKYSTLENMIKALIPEQETVDLSSYLTKEEAETTYLSKAEFVKWFYSYPLPDGTWAIGTAHNFFSEFGISAYGLGTSEEGGGGTGSSYFNDLLDVTAVAETAASGKVWGITSIADDGTATYGWITPASDYQLTKEAVEHVLIGNITTHTHSQYLTSSSLSSYIKTSVADAKYALITDLTSHVNNTDVHVSASDRTNWNSKQDNLDGNYVSSLGGKTGAIGFAQAAKGYGTIQLSINDENEMSAATTLPSWVLSARKPTYSASDVLTTDQQNAVNSGITSDKVSAYDTHVADSSIHVTQTDKDAWDEHIADSVIHVTQDNKNAWDAKWDFDEDVIKAIKVSNAEAADRLAGDDTKTAWGQAYWSSGQPQTISGNMTDVGSIFVDVSNGERQVMAMDGDDPYVGFTLNKEVFTFYDWNKGRSILYYNASDNYLSTMIDKVGIGMSPSYKLDVNGNTRINGNIYLPSSGEYAVCREEMYGNGASLLFKNDADLGNYIGLYDWNNGNGAVWFYAQNTGYNFYINSNLIVGQGVGDDAFIKIGEAFIKYDKTNQALYVDDGNGGGMNFYATGGVAAYSSLAGAGDANLTNLTLENALYLGNVNNGIELDNGLSLKSSGIVSVNTDMNVDGIVTATDIIVGEEGTQISKISFNSSTKKLSFGIGGNTYSVTLS